MENSYPRPTDQREEAAIKRNQGSTPKVVEITSTGECDVD